MDIAQDLLQQLSGEKVDQISRQIGADPGTTEQAISTAVPFLVSALAKNSSQQDGADALFNALQQDHDGGILDDVIGYLGNPEAANGRGILDHVLGNRQNVTENALSRQTGLNTASIGKLLAILAPLIMAYLGKRQRTDGFDPGSLSGYLEGQQQRAQERSPGMIGMLTELLDSNKDGSALDDILKKFSK
jgi:hypothetical protein